MKSKKKLLIIPALLILAVIAAAAFFVIRSKTVNEDTSSDKIYTDPQLLALLPEEEEFNPEADTDHDGLINSEELVHHTDYLLRDTDHDGLSDYDEINHSMTDPLKYDTDHDSLSDGIEIASGLDPLSKYTDEATKDTNRSMTRTIRYDNTCELSINGNAGIYDAYFESVDFTGMSGTPGVISNVYEFHSESSYEEAVISFKYDENRLEKLDIDIDDLAVYNFTDDGTFRKVKTSETDTDKCQVSAKIYTSGKYALCDADTVNTEAVPQVMLLIDNSGSMYPEEMCPDSDESDIEFKRLDMSKKLIEMCGDSISFGLSKFTGTYTQLADLGSSHDELFAQLDNIRTAPETFDGTYIANSIKSALNNFETGDNSHRNFIVLLTDGVTTEGGLWDMSFYNEENAINDANAKNVTIIVIGLGGAVDTDYLTKITTQTVGRYVFANNADALETVYEAIFAAINYDFEDSDDDGKTDGILIADSGFAPDTNGFTFPNYTATLQDGSYYGGQCFGLAEFALLHYCGRLPLTKEANSFRGDALISDTLTAEGYDLNNVSFFAAPDRNYAAAGTLANYKNKTLETFTEITSMPLEDRYKAPVDGYLEFSDEARELIDSSPFIVVRTQKCSKSEFIDGNTYKKYEYASISLENIDISDLSESELEDYEFLTAVSRLFIDQFSDNCSTTGFAFPSVSLSGNAQSSEFSKLIDILNKGIPCLVSTEGHTVNAIRLYRDFDNPMEYTLVLYNNNTPGEEAALKIVKSETYWYDFNAVKWSNDYTYTIYDMDGTFVSSTDNELSLELYSAE